MVDSMEGVSVHVNGELKIGVSSKRCTHTWLMTLTCQTQQLRRVCLLDDSNKKHFHIASVTVGPKKQQKTQTVDEHCQDWLNPDYSTDVSDDAVKEFICRVKVTCWS